MKEQTKIMILIPAGDTFLALSRDDLEQALARGREIVPTRSQHAGVEDDQILDADRMAEMTGVRASWFLEAARRGDIPCLRFGKYRRFRFAEVVESLQSKARHTDKLSVAPKKRAVHQ